MKYNDRSKFIFEREVTLLSNLSKHQNIVNLLDVYEEKNKVPALVLEYVPISLDCLIDEFRIPFSKIENLSSFTFQLSQGLQFLHSNDIVHRDINPSNLLITSNGILKITDFGSALEFASYTDPGNLTPDICTLWYRPPEVLKGLPYSFEVDNWAFGCILGELTIGLPLFSESNETEELDLIITILGGSVSSKSEYFAQRMVVEDRDLLNIIIGLLEIEPSRRYNSDQILVHEFLTSKPFRPMLRLEQNIAVE